MNVLQQLRYLLLSAVLVEPALALEMKPVPTIPGASANTNPLSSDRLEDIAASASLTPTSLEIATTELLSRIEELLPHASQDGPDRWHLESLFAVVNELTIHARFRNDRPWREKALTTATGLLETLPESGAFDLSAHLASGRPLVLAFLSNFDGSLQFSTVQLPPDWTPSAVFPLVVYLHGAGPKTPLDYLRTAIDTSDQDTLWRLGADAQNTHRDAQRRCVLIAPFGRGTTGYRDDALSDIWQSLELIEQRVKTDPDRRYITGFSMGCHGAWRVAASRPDLWAGVNLAAGFGTWSVTADPRMHLNTRSLPVAIWCGELDSFFPGAKRFAAELPPDAKIHTRFVPNLPHTYPYDEYGAMLDWLFQFKRTQPTTFSYEAVEPSNPGRNGVWINSEFVWAQRSTSSRFTCTVEGTTVRITAENCPRLAIEPAALGLNPAEPLKIILNDKKVFDGLAPSPAFEIESRRPFSLEKPGLKLR